MFVIFMVVGVVGLLVMAVPAFGGHGHAQGGHAHGAHLLTTARAGVAVRGLAPRAAGPALAPGKSAALEVVPAEASLAARAARFIPSPRAIFSFAALYGAAGNVCLEAGLPLLTASLVAVVPAAIVERLLVTRLWNTLLASHAPPSAPLDALLLAEATAVTRFANGRGIVAVVREGRLVQFSARLAADEASLPVRVGDTLVVEEIDADEERLTVSMLRKHATRDRTTPVPR